MQRTKEHVIYHGQYAEIEVFPALHHPRARKQKYRPTSEAQQLINQNHAERKLARLIHANFTIDDYALHLTYSDLYEPNSEKAANRDIKNFLRRLRRKYCKLNIELKYVYSVEYASRWHFHMIINSGISRDEIESIWGMGYANADRLEFSEFGLIDLATYVQKERINYKRWQTSRNLIQPAEEERFINKKAADDYADNWNCQSFIESRFPEYWVVLDESECVRNTTNGYDYIRVFLCRKDAKLSFYSTSLAERDDRLKNKLQKRREQLGLDIIPESFTWQQEKMW